MLSQAKRLAASLLAFDVEPERDARRSEVVPL
jgi:hypothetical protein